MTACSCSYPIHAIECDCGQPAPQTPERIAAAALVASGLISAGDGLRAVEAIAAAGLVIVPAGRVAAWMGAGDA